MAVLYVLDPGFHFLGRNRMAAQAGAVQVLQRAAHVMIAHLHGALPQERHVAIGAGHAGARVHALAVSLELGVLRLEHRGAGLAVSPVAETELVVVTLDLLDLQALRPGVSHNLMLAGEVMLDVALRADICAHLLAGCHGVGIVVLFTLALLERLDTNQKSGARHPQLHRGRVVTLQAADGMIHQLARLRKRHGGDGLETLHDVTPARLAVCRQNRAVALQAATGLRPLSRTARVVLIDERPGVPAGLVVFERESESGENALQPRVALQVGERDASAVLSSLHLAVALEAVELPRKVAAPDSGVHRVFGDRDHRDVRLAPLPLPILYVHEHHGDQEGSGRDRTAQKNIGPARRSHRSLLGPWPAPAWQAMQSRPAISLTICSWQRRQLAARTSELKRWMRMGSGKSCRVKWSEWFQPLRALTKYFPASEWGVWQSLQTAAAWCGPRCHESSCSRMTWQLAQASGRLLKYE